MSEAKPDSVIDVLAQLERDAVGDERVVAVRDVRERPAVDERRLPLERLHEVRLDRLLEDDRERACRLDVVGGDRLALVGLPDGDAAQSLPEVGEVARDGDEPHDLARRGDVEAGLPGSAVRAATEAGDDVPEVPVVHVEAAAPGDRERVETGRVAVVEMRVDERREQVVGRGDRVQVAGEVQVQVLHRHDLRVAAAGCATLHAEDRAERCLAKAEHRLAAERAEPLRERHRRRRLSLARRRGRDRRDVDQLRVGAVGEPLDDGEIDLRLVAPVRLHLLGQQLELVRHVEDRAQGRALRDLEAGRHHGCHSRQEASGSPRLRPARKRACRCGSARARTARSGRASCPVATSSASVTPTIGAALKPYVPHPVETWKLSISVLPRIGL